jgi:two-component system, cell cycle response regulator
LFGIPGDATAKPNTMSNSVTVAILGFSSFERATLDAFFRLTVRRPTRYVFEPLAHAAQLVLVDADMPELFKGAGIKARRCVFIGARAMPGALIHLPRPINMMSLLRQMDAALAPKTEAKPAAPAPVPLPATPRLMPADYGPDTVRGTTAMDHVLVVDDNDLALSFMAEVLGRYGYGVHLARSGEEALRRVSERHFEFVFMDVNMPGLNGHQSCKLIKNSPYAKGRTPPTVVMLTSRDRLADRLRGTLAGADHYLTKPLQRDALLRVVGARVVAQAADSDTVIGAY